MPNLPSHKDFVEKAPDLILIFGMLFGLVLSILGIILDIFTDLPVGTFKFGAMEATGINTVALTGVLILSVSSYWYIKKKEKIDKKTGEIKESDLEKYQTDILKKTESEKEELGKILYYLEQLDEFTITEAENICQKIDGLIANNRIYLSEDFSKDWVKLKHRLYAPEAVKLKENLQNQLRKKLEK